MNLLVVLRKIVIQGQNNGFKPGFSRGTCRIFWILSAMGYDVTTTFAYVFW